MSFSLQEYNFSKVKFFIKIKLPRPFLNYQYHQKENFSSLLSREGSHCLAYITDLTLTVSVIFACVQISSHPPVSMVQALFMNGAQQCFTPTYASLLLQSTPTKYRLHINIHICMTAFPLDKIVYAK